MMSDDAALWKRRFHLFALLRLAGVAMFLFGLGVMFSDLLRPGGWPFVGGLLIVVGVVDAVVAPRILKRSWDRK
jgi:hypothetical protein